MDAGVRAHNDIQFDNLRQPRKRWVTIRDRHRASFHCGATAASLMRVLAGAIRQLDDYEPLANAHRPSLAAEKIR
jgi:hypothetical protein